MMQTSKFIKCADQLRTRASDISALVKTVCEDTVDGDGRAREIRNEAQDMDWMAYEVLEIAYQIEHRVKPGGWRVEMVRLAMTQLPTKTLAQIFSHMDGATRTRALVSDEVIDTYLTDCIEVLTVSLLGMFDSFEKELTDMLQELKPNHTEQQDAWAQTTLEI